MAGFFPLFFKQYWSQGISPTQSTYYLGLSNSISSLILVILGPVLGAIADQSNGKKFFLSIFLIIGALSVFGLYYVGPGAWLMAITLYALASFGFSGTNVFYDALLLDVSPANKLDFVSGLGYALGYLGGGLLFVVNVLMFLNPHWFFLSDQVAGIKTSFISVAVWWLIFSIPLFLYVKEGRSTFKLNQKVWLEGWRSFIDTFKKIKALKPLFLFLLGYMFYIDGVNTIIKMAVDYGMSIGLEPKHLITALLIVQFVGFPAAIFFGYLGEKLGPKTGIYIALAVYTLITFLAFRMTTSQEFYVMAIVIGLVQGGIQSLSRSFYARMVPKESSAEFFGFFNMLGKFSAIIGPFMVGWVSITMNNPRFGILVILFSFLIGAVLLARVKVKG